MLSLNKHIKKISFYKLLRIVTVGASPDDATYAGGNDEVDVEREAMESVFMSLQGMEMSIPVLLKFYDRNHLFTKFGLVTISSYLYSLFTFRNFDYLIIVK